MKRLLTIFLTFLCVVLYGQNEKELLGQYSHSFFMYSYKLTLSDSGQFSVVEHSDMGSKTTKGNWKLNRKAIELIPTKCYTWDERFPEKEIREISLDYAEKRTIEIGKNNELTLKASTQKQPEWIKSKPQDYKLRKLTILDNDFFTVTFITNSTLLKSKKDSLILDSVGEMLTQYSKEFKDYKVRLIPYYSPNEASSDKYIGVKRCQELKEYLISKYKIDNLRFWIQDVSPHENLKESSAWICLEKWTRDDK